MNARNYMDGRSAVTGRRLLVVLAVAATAVAVASVATLFLLRSLAGGWYASHGPDVRALLLVEGYLAPAVEELIFRGGLLGWLSGRLPFPVAALVSAALFAGAHLVPTAFAYLFVFGLATAWIVRRTGSTFNSFAMHACQNSLAVLSAYALLANGRTG